MAEPRPSLKDRFHTYVPRFVTNPTMARQLSQDTGENPLLKSPEASWTKAIKTESGERLPQVIAHRGYRSKYPENTMLSFLRANDAGAHALETDVHLTKDNVVVLSHDPSLKRCYGEDKLVADCDWSYIKTLRTKAEPHEPMPRLVDLLEYLAKPEQQHLWLLLDIKMDDEPDMMMSCIAAAIASVPASGKSWQERIVLGIWAVKFLRPCSTHLPDFPLSNIGFSTIYAKRFLTPRTPNVTFNMLYWTLMMPISGPRFIKKAKESGRAVYAWTVNDEQVMKWCMKQKLDAIITDDVEKLVNVRVAWENGSRKFSIPIRQWMFTIWIWLLTVVLQIWLWRLLDKKGGLKSRKK